MIKKIENLIQKAINSLEKEGLLMVNKDARPVKFASQPFNGVKIVVGTPSNQDYGDYSTNVALLLAKKNKKRPDEIAETIISKLEIISKIS